MNIGDGAVVQDVQEVIECGVGFDVKWGGYEWREWNPIKCLRPLEQNSFIR